MFGCTRSLKKELCEQLHRIISIMKQMLDSESSASIEILLNSFYKLYFNTLSSSKFNNAVAVSVIFKLNLNFMDRWEFIRIVVENLFSWPKLNPRCEVYVIELILCSMTKCECTTYRIIICYGDVMFRWYVSWIENENW